MVADKIGISEELADIEQKVERQEAKKNDLRIKLNNIRNSKLKKNKNFVNALENKNQQIMDLRKLIQQCQLEASAHMNAFLQQELAEYRAFEEEAEKKLEFQSRN